MSTHTRLKAGAMASVCTAAALALGGPALTAAAETGIAALDEVVVTAQKRSERLQDVPVPVTAVAADSLLQTNRLRLQDFYTTVPGLNVQASGDGDQSVSIRGVTTGGGTNRTVGVIVDESPFGTTTGLGSRTFSPDLDPGDLERVEVLRGPQGTLYGASSLGGLIKFVTVDPSTDRVSGRLQADVSSVSHARDAGYSVRGSINLPISDTLAVRVSGFDRRTPGYYDDPVFGVRGLNQEDSYGGRASLLWRPSDAWSLKFSMLAQDLSADGHAQATLQPGLGELQQVQTLPVGAYRKQVQSYALTLTAKLGEVDLTSISGYNVDKYEGTRDVSGVYGFYSTLVFGSDVGGVALAQHSKTSKFSQEFRLSGTAFGKLDWIAGLFYTHEDSPTHDVFTSFDTTSISPVGVFIDDPYPTTFAEYALFADLAYHVTDRFDVQVGGRESQNRQWYEESISGPFDLLLGLPSPAIQPRIHTKDNAFTYLVTPRFKITPDLMVYARFASGYRPGGPNATCVLFPAPCQYAPDKTYNYELGVKGDAFDRLLSFDLSAYYIDWKNIQLQVSDAASGAVYYTNASGAKSHGVELSAKLRPLPDLTIASWITYGSATLSSDLPPGPAVGVKGDRLPYSSRFSGNVSINGEFPLSGTVRGFAGGSVSYVGAREEVFSSSLATPRNRLPGYAQANINGGVLYNDWTVNLALNNLTDKRGVLGIANPGAVQFRTIAFIEPRTVSLSLTRAF